MGKSKHPARFSKKQQSKAAPSSADEFQDAADKEEEAGGKHRVGDPSKSARAFMRALDIYDKALERYPNNFDLAYNKARLRLEFTQQPTLVEHVGLPLIELLKQTLDAHRYALRLNEENADVLFNTSQVLTALAEQLSENGQAFQAVPLLQESLELLSACLSRQEMLLEQQKMDFDDLEDGGIQLDPNEKPASPTGSDVSEQTARIETPITPNDLLDTVHASLSALTTMLPLVEQSTLQTYADMAYSLTETRGPSYVTLLPAYLQDSARFSLFLDKAIFIAAFADAQYSFHMIELPTYLDRLESFDIPGKSENAHALCAEAEARTEFAQSGLERYGGSPDVPAELCWKQLGVSQDLYSKALDIESEDAKERKADMYDSKGSVELLRHRLATLAHVSLSDSIKKSASTLVQNAQTYYKAAAQFARADGNRELENKTKQRWIISTDIGAALYGVEPKQPLPFEGNSSSARDDLTQALEDCVEEGLIDMALGSQIAKRIRQ